MPGFELFGEEERKEVKDVLDTGILMRYGFDGPRKGIWKAKELEQEIRELKRANEILKRAAIFFGAELDRQHKK